MSVSRRQMLGGAALLGAAGAIGMRHVAGQGGRTPVLVVYDSRKPASLAFAGGHGGKRRLDLAQAASWSLVRGVERQGPVAGLTSWNDYVSARQWLEEKGLRVVAEAPDRARGLIAWTMA